MWLGPWLAGRSCNIMSSEPDWKKKAKEQGERQRRRKETLLAFHSSELDPRRAVPLEWTGVGEWNAHFLACWRV